MRPNQALQRTGSVCGFTVRSGNQARRQFGRPLNTSSLGRKSTVSETRSLTAHEFAAVDRALDRLRAHFHLWPGYEGREQDLVTFAFYEGCGGSDATGTLLREVAPFALGSALVRHHGFRWVMALGQDGWTYCVSHPQLDDIIDVFSLEDSRWDWDDRRDEPALPGELTNASFESLVAATQKRRPGAA